VPFQIRRCADKDHLDGGPDRRRDHVPGDLLTQPDTGTEAVFRYIMQRIFNADLDIDVWISRRRFSSVGQS